MHSSKLPTGQLGIGTILIQAMAAVVWFVNAYEILPQPIPAEIGISIAGWLGAAIMYWKGPPRTPQKIQ